ATRRVTTIYSAAEPISMGLFGDGTSFYLMEGFSFHRYDPDLSLVTFATGPVGASTAEVSKTPSLMTLHGEIQFSAGNGGQVIRGILGYRNPAGVLVSETAVPAQTAIQTGRIYAKVAGPVNTGVAMANPNDTPAQITFYLTDMNGLSTNPGTLILAPHA